MDDKDAGLEAVETSAALVGDRLRKAREDAGMTQDFVSQQTGFPTRSITRWENGQADLSLGKVVRLATLYGVSLDWITGRTELRQCVQPGSVLIDNDALARLEALANRGATIRDVPLGLIRSPGINYANVVPTDASVLSPQAVEAVEAKVRSLWTRLGGQS